MKILNLNQTLYVHGGADSLFEEEESPSLVGDLMFFFTFGAATGGFGAYLLVSIFTQSTSLLIGATTIGALLGVGACIGIAAT